MQTRTQSGMKDGQGELVLKPQEHLKSCPAADKAIYCTDWWLGTQHMVNNLTRKVSPATMLDTKRLERVTCSMGAREVRLRVGRTLDR